MINYYGLAYCTVIVYVIIYRLRLTLCVCHNFFLAIVLFSGADFKVNVMFQSGVAQKISNCFVCLFLFYHIMANSFSYFLPLVLQHLSFKQNYKPWALYMPSRNFFCKSESLAFIGQISSYVTFLCIPENRKQRHTRGSYTYPAGAMLAGLC